MQEINMNQHILKKSVLDPTAMENDIQFRLKRGKIKLLISHILFFLLTMSFIFFVL